MNKIKGHFGIILIYVLVAITILLWLLPGKIVTLNSIGQISGLIGMILMSISIILGSRIKFLEKYFYSQNNVYVKHHYIGGISFVLLLLHPIFLTTKLLSLENIAQNFGSISLVIMIVLMVLTFFVKISYKKWYLSHKFLGIVYIFAGLHLITINSDVSSNVFLRIFMMVIFLMGMFALIYRTIIPNIAVKKYEYKVANKKIIGRHLFLSLITDKEKMEYRAGQFVFVEKYGEVHPFSLSSNGEVLELIIGVRGNWTTKLKEISINDDIIIDGPYGKFGQDIESEEEVWIAGGVGIVPFVGLLKERKNKKITLYYSVKDKSEFVNKEEFEKMISENFKVYFIESNIQGRLTAEKVLNNNPLAKYLLCGPTPMTQSIRDGLLKLGINKKNIISEEFFLK